MGLLQHVYSMDPPVHVLYNGERSMQINIPKWMSGQGDQPGPSQLCGVCGPGLDNDRDAILGHNPMSCANTHQHGQKVSPRTTTNVTTLYCRFPD